MPKSSSESRTPSARSRSSTSPRAARVGHHGVLGQLAREPLARHAPVREPLGDRVGQPGVEDVRRREVDRDRHLDALVLPARACCSAASITQRVRSPIMPVRSASGRNSAGSEQPVARMLPAHERLDAGDLAAVHRHLRLVVQHELAVARARRAARRAAAAAPASRDRARRRRRGRGPARAWPRTSRRRRAARAS